MDTLHARLEALESQVHTLHQQARAMERRRRWWRRLACGLGVLGCLGWTLQAGTAGDGQVLSIPDRFAALERKLAPLTFFNAATHELVLTGANLCLLNGLGSTETTNGLGNLIVGYNEPRDGEGNLRTGSHVSGGVRNTAAGAHAAISGGRDVRQEVPEGWAAGSRGVEVAGRFRSP